MFGNIVVGVDGSPTGHDAVALAAALAEPGSVLTLVHVYGGVPTPGHLMTPTFLTAAKEHSDQLLEEERAAAGVAAELLSFRAPSVGRGLHAAAEERSADLLVVGSHSRGLIGRVLVGDDTSASLNGAPCAIAVAPRGYVARSGGFMRIGVAYDFSPESHAALQTARELAERNGAKLRAMHVVALPTWSYVAMMPANWGDILEEDRKEAEEKIGGLEQVAVSAVYGLPVEELASFGDRVDLLVVGSRNYGPVRRLVLGSTSGGLARHARCALLVLPRAIAGAARHESVGESVAAA